MAVILQFDESMEGGRALGVTRSNEPLLVYNKVACAMGEDVATVMLPTKSRTKVFVLEVRILGKWGSNHCKYRPR